MALNMVHAAGHRAFAFIGSGLIHFSTVDFCYADLGYLVAHRFLGDIPVQKDGNGNLTAMPRLFNRGSIERPPLRK